MLTDAAASEDRLVVRLRAAGCVFAEDEARLLLEAATGTDALEALVARRVAGEPLETLLGWAGFCGLRVAVRPGVFVPRRRTEFLAELAIAQARPGQQLLDLCCGSGALALVVATAVPGLTVTAVDISDVAVACARQNLEPIGGSVIRSDLFSSLPPSLRDHIDVLVCNAPYVPSGAMATMPPEAREYEPMSTLDGGDDGLDVHRRVAAEVAPWLAVGGRVFVEASSAQASRSATIFERAGLGVHVEHDSERDATVVVGRRR